MTRIDFDPAKNTSNLAKHGVALAEAVEFEPIVTREDDRFDYGETRFQSFGILRDRYAVLVWTPRGADGEIVRAISLRFAHEEERADYEQA